MKKLFSYWPLIILLASISLLCIGLNISERRDKQEVVSCDTITAAVHSIVYHAGGARLSWYRFNYGVAEISLENGDLLFVRYNINDSTKIYAELNPRDSIKYFNKTIIGVIKK
jgi:hypothetical protein